MMKKKGIRITSFMLAILIVFSTISPTIYAIHSEEDEEKINLERVEELEGKKDKENDNSKIENLVEEIEKNKFEDNKLEVGPVTPEKEITLVGKVEKEEGLFEFAIKLPENLRLPSDKSLKDIIFGAMEADNEIKEEIKEGDITYKLEDISFILEDSQIDFSKEEFKGPINELKTDKENIDKVVEFLDSDYVNLDFSKLSEIKFNYKKVKNIKINIEGIDTIHKDIILNEKQLDFSSTKESEELKITLGSKNIEFTIGDTSKTWYLPTYYSIESIVIDKTEHKIDSEETNIEKELELKEDIEIKITVNLKPDEITDYYGKLKFKNLYNSGEIIYKLMLGDVADKKGYEIDNENKTLKLDYNGTYDKENEEIKFVTFENREDEHKEDKTIYYNDKIGYKLPKSILEEIVGERYRLEGLEDEDEISFEVSGKETYKEINFDYKRKEVKIVHQSNIGDDKDATIELMPDTKYLYIKPQSGGSIEVIEVDEDGYYKIDIDKVKEIVIKYDGKVPDIKTVDYQVQNTQVSKNGSESSLNSLRKFTGYAGSKFAVNPIYQNEYDGKSQIKIGSNRFADYFDKFISIEEGKVELLGYGNQLEKLNEDVIEDIKDKTIKFRFIDQDSVLYRIIHRTGFGSHKGEGNYDLELENEDSRGENIVESKYYVVPNGSKVSISPLDTERDELKGYKLITSENPTSSEPKNIISKKENDGLNYLYLGGKIENREVNGDTVFIYSYKLTYKDITNPDKVNIKYSLNIPDRDPEAPGHSITNSYPRLKEDYTVLLPITDIVNCYGLKSISVDLPEGISKLEVLSGDKGTVLEEIEGEGELTDEDIIKTSNLLRLTISGTGKDGDIKDFFPKEKKEITNKKMARSLRMKRSLVEEAPVEEIIENKGIVLNYGEKIGTVCNTAVLEEREVEVNIRYEKDGVYETQELYTIKALKGSIVSLFNYGKELSLGDDSNYLYKYIDYDEGKDNTGISDENGKHIKAPKFDDVGNSSEKVDLSENNNRIKLDGNEKETYYFNYSREKREVPKLEIYEENNIFTKKYYYIPFSYFTSIEDNKEELNKKLIDGEPEAMGHLGNSSCKVKNILPLDKDDYNRKYNDLKKWIEEYYEKYSERNVKSLKNYYELEEKDKINLNNYLEENNSEKDTIEKYFEYLESKKVELEKAKEELENQTGLGEDEVSRADKEKEENPDEENKNLEERIEEIEGLLEDIKSEVEAINSFIKEFKLVDYLEDYKDVPIKSEALDEKFDIHGDLFIGWKDKVIKGDSIHRYKSKIKEYDDLVNNKKYKEYKYKTTRYSKVPLSISSSLYDENDLKEGNTLNNFILDPNNGFKEGEGLKDVQIKKDFEKDNEIPLIYLEREHLCKGVEVEDIKEPEVKPPIDPKNTQLTIKYYISHVKKDGKYTELNPKKEFYTHTIGKIPSYMEGGKIGWKINDFTSIGLGYMEDDIYEVSNNIKWSKPIELNKENILEFNYYSEKEDPTIPEIKKGSIELIGYDLDTGDVIYKEVENYKDLPVGSVIKILPYELEYAGYYLSIDGVLTSEFERYGREVEVEEGKKEIKYYYKKPEGKGKIKKYEIDYLNRNEEEIAERDNLIWYVEEKDDGKEILRLAKTVNGYTPSIKSKTFIITKDGDIKMKSGVGYEILEEGEKEIFKKLDDPKKIVEIDKSDKGKFKIKFYYDKNIEIKPEPIPEDDSKPIDTGEKIKFIYDGNQGLVDGKEEKILVIDKGSRVKDEIIAYRKGYKFLGWGIDKKANKFFDFTKPINKDTRVYAIWEKEINKLDRINHMEYIQGYPDNTIRGERNIDRQEVAAVFYRILDQDYKETIYSSEYKFNDFVHDWSLKYIGTLTNGEILTGYPDGSFRPRAYITRGEVAAIASRFDNLAEVEHNFSDVEGHWAEKYIGSATKKGWIVGYPDGSFKPDDYISRGEFVTLVNRVLNRGIKKNNIPDNVKKFKDLKPTDWYYEDFVESINGHDYYREGQDTRDNEVWTELKKYNKDM